MAGDEDFPWPRAQEARGYLAKHKVLELFNNMTAQLIYKRPGEQKFVGVFTGIPYSLN